MLPSIRNTSYCKRIQGKLNRNQQQQQQSIQSQHYQQYQQPHQFQQQQPHHFQQQGYLGGSGGGLIGGVHPLNDLGSSAVPTPTSPFNQRHPFSSSTTTTFSNQ